jgi:erythromycin esterase
MINYLIKSLFFTFLLTASLCTEAGQPVSNEMPSNSSTLHVINNQELIELKQVSSPLAGSNPSIDDKDLASFGALIGNAKVVGLGEATHGTHEFLLIKHRLLEYLVKRKGFTIFAVEANMTEANLLNGYILQGKGDPKKLLKGLYFWTLNTQEFLDLVKWMREYDKNAKIKIQFAGFDMQYTDGSAKNIKTFLKDSGDIAELSEVDSVIKELNNLESSKNDNYMKFINDFQKSPDVYLTVLLRIHDIQRHVSANPNNLDPKQFAWASHNVRILEQKTQSLIDTTERDRAMAENVVWISHENPNEKMVISAHNDHIKRFDQSYLSMGKHLSNSFGSQYRVIALTTLQGTYTAMSKNNSNVPSLRRDIAIPVVEAGTLEDNLNKMDKPIVLINLNLVRQQNAPRFLLNPIYWLNIGASEVPNPFLIQNVSKGLDGIIYIKNTTASRSYL